MLNGNDKISGFKTNRSNQQKTNCTCSTLFLLISKKQICTNLSFPSLCFARLRPCSKTSNFLVSHYFLWKNCRMCLPNIVFPVFMFAFIFHCRVWCHFHLADRQHSLFSRRRALNFHVFLLRNSSPLFSITRFSSFSVIHVSVNIKNDAEKDTTLSLFFLFKSPDGHVISFQIEP